MTAHMEALHKALDTAVRDWVQSERPDALPSEWVIIAGAVPLSDHEAPTVHLAHSEYTPFWRVSGLLRAAVDMEAGEPYEEADEGVQ